MCSKWVFIYRTGLVVGIVFLIIGLTPIYYHYQKSFAAQVKDPQDKSTQQKAWKPAGPLTFIVAMGGGSAYDFLARQIAQVLPDYIGKPVIVQISPGAAGAIGLDMLQRAKPDGRTFALYGVGAQIALALENPYKWNVKDLNLILAINAPPYVVCVSSKSKYKDFKDLMKAKEEVTLAFGGPNFGLLPLILQLEKSGVKYRAARFKGASESNLAVVAGDADMTINAASSFMLDPIRAGDFRPLWVFANKRCQDLPDVPTHIELGMPQEWASYNLIRLIAMASGVPVDIRNTFTEALIKTLQDKRTVEWSKKAEIPVDIIQRKELEERIRVAEEGFRKNVEIVKRYVL